MNRVYSDELVLNTGVPQGCDLSPLLFSVYTNEMTVCSSIVQVFKYADEMALVGLFLKDNATHEDAYFSQVTVLHDWCQASKKDYSGELRTKNTNKTKWKQ